MSRAIVAKALIWTAVYGAGFAAGVLMHYALHRLLLTTEPFIYISF